MSVTNKPRPNKATSIAVKKQRSSPPELDADYFAEVWNASATLTALAEKLGVSASTCALVASRLRKAGYALKWFRKGRPRVLGM